jgi:CheY-like chemotaxis protein
VKNMSTALIIEDNPDNLTLITDILELNGFNTVYANTGYRGVEDAVSKHPDFIILDIQLPDIDGYTVLDLIRENDTTKNIPVIAMTSYAMIGDKERLLSSGCDGYIEKPINPINVIDQIRAVIGNL